MPVPFPLIVNNHVQLVPGQVPAMTQGKGSAGDTSVCCSVRYRVCRKHHSFVAQGKWSAGDMTSICYGTR
jgi:hypothetical protein